MKLDNGKKKVKLLILLYVMREKDNKLMLLKIIIDLYCCIVDIGM